MIRVFQGLLVGSSSSRVLRIHAVSHIGELHPFLVPSVLLLIMPIGIPSCYKPVIEQQEEEVCNIRFRSHI